MKSKRQINIKEKTQHTILILLITTVVFSISINRSFSDTIHIGWYTEYGNILEGNKYNILFRPSGEKNLDKIYYWYNLDYVELNDIIDNSRNIKLRYGIWEVGIPCKKLPNGVQNIFKIYFLDKKISVADDIEIFTNGDVSISLFDDNRTLCGKANSIYKIYTGYSSIDEFRKTKHRYSYPDSFKECVP